MPHLYLIRHGKPATVWGQGSDEDPGLDDQGRAQAEAARDALLARPENERPKRVVSSPLRRCRETAQPLADALGVEVEIDSVVGEIPTPSTIAPENRSAWLRQVFQSQWGEIEGDLDYDEWRHAIARSLRARGDTAVFSHYVAINAVMSHLEGHDQVLSFRPDHCSITVLETDGEELRLVEKGREATTGVL
ncbi:histidine phosphatase family protein [Phenylobacterium sp.]|jgi:broad specificity phosphatase PhoE|uniref:histidine phosphatase family protein n=1 Tax=Phenylobacterium sp. TaxID=1871053 RepID=UPI002E373296|nr:histidine phosphatase family protein [Phenylobacterium sp.]HEX2561140.1 histidine phosphatase family protein [Phenylobacterium sp.]